jgi:uncharacterized protein (TIGR02186 family)
MKKTFYTLLFSLFFITESFASPIISGISTNEINIDTKFTGAEILLFGAKGDVGNIIIAVRGPKKNFLVTKKERLLGIWHNGERIKFKNSYSFYSLFSNLSDPQNQDPHKLDELLAEFEIGQNNLQFSTSEKDLAKRDDFQIQLINRLEQNQLYATNDKTHGQNIDFLNETLFKVILFFPKNIARGAYTVEIYLVNESGLLSFQSIPIYVNQVGFSAKILDFAYQKSILYGFLTVLIALVVGWLANYLFIRFIGK